MSKCFFLFLFSWHILYALPSGKKVTYGQILESVKPGELHLLQSSKKAIIEWDSFSIDKNEITRFSQPSEDSAILNRVTGKDLSSIMGRLESNGKVYLLNENGILVGKTGVIDTGAFIASTLRVLDEAFLKGGDLEFKGDSQESVINLGKITADQDVFLFAKKVENQGNLSSKNAAVGLASGQILLKEGSEERIFVSPELTGMVTNTGRIEALQIEMLAAGNNIYSLAVNHEGIIDATNVENKNGRVILKSLEGITRVDGIIVNTGVTRVLGENVHLDKAALIDASNEIKGGTVLIGGDYQGANQSVPNAKITNVDPDAKIYASALVHGDGGKVIVWGDTVTNFWGRIEAKGGELSGDGGFVEVSSLKDLRYKGFVTTEAFNGKTGKLLLDPSDITISGAVSSPVYTSPTNPDWPNYNPTTATADLDVADLITALATNDVQVLTSNGAGGNGTVSVNSAVTWSSTNTFTITADQNIVVSGGGSIVNTSATTSTIPVIVLEANTLGLGTNSFIGIEILGTVSTVGSSITMEATGGATGVSSQFGISIFGGTVTTETGAITLTGTGGGDGTVAGNIGVIIKGSGQLTSTGGTGPNPITILANGGLGGTLNHGFELVNFSANIETVAADIVITATAGGFLDGNYGINLISGAITTESGAVTLTGVGGGTGTSDLSIGVIVDGVTIESTGTSGAAPITIVATAGNTTGMNYGYFSPGGIGLILSDSADISITGIAKGTSVPGVYLGNPSISSVSGDITITGVGAELGATGNFGIAAGSDITTDTGAITLMGTGGGTGDGNYGICLSFGTISSSGTVSPGAISFSGIGATGLNQNYGIFVEGSDSNVFSDAADVIFSGIAHGTGSDNIGIFIDNAGSTGPIVTSSGNITISGYGSTLGTSGNIGVDIDNSTLSTTSGVVNIVGVGGGSTTSNYGIYMGAAALIESIDSVSPGSITLQGTGGAGTSDNTGVFLEGVSTSVTTDAADVIISGTANGTTSNNIGVYAGATGTVSTVSGSITISGNGSALGTTGNIGVDIDNSTVSTTSGVVNIVGIGGGSTTSNYGIYLEAAALIESTGSVSPGSITLQGTGGAGTSENIGVFLEGVSTSVTTDAADVIISGTANGTTSNNIGVYVGATGTVSTVSGNITISGNGSTTSTTDTNTGVGLAAGTISTTSGAINITGVGGSGTDVNHGISLEPGSTLESTGSVTPGAITLMGTGGLGTLTNSGVLLEDATTLITTDAADITITGIGSTSGSSGNEGICDHAVIVSTNGGVITLNGTGGGNGTSIGNIGIEVVGGSIQSLGTPGTITLTGIGGSGTDNIHGVLLSGVGTSIESTVSLISVIGIASGSGTGNNGIILNDSIEITSITGDIELSGTGTTLGSGAGVRLLASTLIETTTSGTITISGTGSNTGSGTEGISMSGAAEIGDPLSTGDINFNTDTINLDEGVGSAIIHSAGAFTLHPITLSTSIGLGDSTTGTLNLNNNELGSFQDGFSLLTFGSPLSLGSVEMKGFTYLDPLVVNGENITISTAVSSGANTATFNVGTVNAGTFNLDAIITASTVSINGGANDDTFNINITGQTATVDGIAGSNNLVGPIFANIWAVGPSDDEGTLNTTLSFTNIENLTGNTLDDTFSLADGAGISGTINGGTSGVNLLDYSAYTTPVSVNLAAMTATNVGMILNINSFQGSGNVADEIIGPNIESNWVFTGSDVGTVTYGTTSIDFADFANIIGGNQSDIFDLTGGSLTGLIDGGPGSNEIISPNTANTWHITEINEGDINSISYFTRIQNLTGNAMDDEFVFTDQKGVSGIIDGGLGGTNTLDYSNYTTKVTVNLTLSTATGSGGIVNLDTFIGGMSVDTIRGPNENNLWETTGTDQGTITNSGTQTFTDFENISGGPKDDTFDLLLGDITGIINGGHGGINTLDYSNFAVPVFVNLSTKTATNANRFININNLIGSPTPNVNTLTGPLSNSGWTFSGVDTGTIINEAPVTFLDFSNIIGGSHKDTFDFRMGTITGLLDGGAGSNIFLAPNIPNTWLVTGDNAGSVIGFPFINITDLVGGNDTDDFVFSDGVTLAGLVDGGKPSGINTLDYTAFTTPVEVVFLTDTSGLASNLGIGFQNIQNVIGNANIRLLQTTPLTIDLNLSIRQLERFNYFDQFIPIRYINMYSPINGVFSFYDVWEYIRHIQYQMEKQ